MVGLSALGICMAAATATARAPIARASSILPAHPAPPVALNYWRGRHHTRTYIRTTRPRVLGSSFGAPISGIHWKYWGQHSARGHGVVVHMGRHRVTIYLHDVGSLGSQGRYFKKLRERFHGSTAYLRWSWSKEDWTG